MKTIKNIISYLFLTLSVLYLIPLIILSIPMIISFLISVWLSNGFRLRELKLLKKQIKEINYGR